MNRQPGVSPPVLRTVIILIMEAVIGFAIYQFRGLAKAVRDATARYEQHGNYEPRQPERNKAP